MSVGALLASSVSVYWKCRGRDIDLDTPVIMGIVNVTPDSFSDGGLFIEMDAAVEHGLELARGGAAILDVGGESTRPGAAQVSAQMQIDRVCPVIRALALRTDAAISVDTSEPEVMRAAIDAGACIVNDVRALQRAGAAAVCAAAGVGVCLVHMQGEPETMQVDPQYSMVTAEVTAFLQARRTACVGAGIARESIVLDPGIGFGKTFSHNMTLLKEIPALTTLGSALLIGVSRKNFIGKILNDPLHDRLYGGLALAAWALSHGARIIRTHDVAPTADVATTVNSLLHGAGWM